MQCARIRTAICNMNLFGKISEHNHRKRKGNEEMVDGETDWMHANVDIYE